MSEAPIYLEETMPVGALFSIAEMADIRDALNERGQQLTDLIREAVLNDLFR